MVALYDTIIGASTRKEWPAWCMTFDSSAPDGPRAAVEAIVSGEDTKHRIVTFLWGGRIILIGELRFDLGRKAFEKAQRLCARLWRDGLCKSSSFQSGFAYEFYGDGKIQKSADLRTFWAQWHKAVNVLSNGSRELELCEDEDGFAVGVMLTAKHHTILWSWDAIPEYFQLDIREDCIAIWPHYPNVMAYTMTPGLLALLNKHAPMPGATWLADSVTTASPKRTGG